jgi:hypothetical protein
MWLVLEADKVLAMRLLGYSPDSWPIASLKPVLKYLAIVPYQILLYSPPSSEMVKS